MEERIRFHSGPYRLEGFLDHSNADRGVIITHPHPLYGGDMDNYVVKSILEEYRKKGYTTLRFNFRGVGGSKGVHDDKSMGVQTDVRAAIAYLYAQGIKEVELAGYSFGAWVNAHMDCKAEKICRMLMVSPPVDLLSFENVQAIPCPCLVICGDKDEFASVENVQKMLTRCQPDAVLEVIPHCNHFYTMSLRELEDFLKRHLEPCKAVSAPGKIFRKTSVDVKRFFRGCNPAYTLDISKEEDRKYYIDFSSVRSGSLLREIKRTISLSDKPVSQILTGHDGCGKSTELLRLKKELEDDNYHAVYIASGSDTDTQGLSDLLRLIAQKTGESLREKGIHIDYELSDLTAKADKPESGADHLTDSISREIIALADQKVKEAGKSGLVVIADGLEHMLKHAQNEPKQMEMLRQPACHTIFTVPLSLMYSGESENLKQHFSDKPKVLAMVPVLSRNGEIYEKGLHLLKQTVMTRAFPDADEAERIKMAHALFEKPEMLETVCRMSGGSAGNLMRLLFTCLQKNDPPFPPNTLEEVLREQRDELMRKIQPHEKDLLHKVMENPSAVGQKEYESLVCSHFVFEYQDKDGVWFGLNPLLNL
ncbi:MAG: alpha/beta family hydrolase [Desulfococcaceae bacterium]